MYGADKMDTEDASGGNSREIGRTRDFGGVNEGRKDHGFGLGTI